MIAIKIIIISYLFFPFIGLGLILCNKKTDYLIMLLPYGWLYILYKNG